MRKGAGSLTGWFNRIIKRKILDEVDFLPSGQSLPECPSFLEDLSGGDAAEAEYLYSVLTLEPLHIFPLRVKNVEDFFEAVSDFGRD